MARRIVTVFGGSGFLGRHVVQRLAADGFTVRVAVRDTEAASFLKPLGGPGQIVPIKASVTDPEAVALVVKGAQAVVNLVGILYESGRATFRLIHAEGAAIVAKASAAAGVKRLVHVSALGADAASPSAYARTKAEGEAAVLEAFPGATILRPSVVFGPEDGFFNLFASLATVSPVLPVMGAPFPPKVTLFGGGDSLVDIDLYGGGGPRFQPVYVEDVAESVRAALTDTAAKGRIFEVVGPKTYSFKEVMELVLSATGRRCWLMPVPFWLARLQAAILGLLPKPLLTKDQVILLGRDNIATGTLPTQAGLGVGATAAEGILPAYLGRFRPQLKQAERLA
ncbi:MAG: complex I NDUFA9 subunit family protein [Magnetospirillum sp. WYHS-4]